MNSTTYNKLAAQLMRNATGVSCDLYLTPRKGRNGSRHEREVAQRVAARRRYAQARKMLPKKIRARAIRAEKLANARLYFPDPCETTEWSHGDDLSSIWNDCPSTTATTESGVAETLKFAGLAGLAGISAKLLLEVGNLVKEGKKALKSRHVILEELSKSFEWVKATCKRIMKGLWVFPMALLLYATFQMYLWEIPLLRSIFFGLALAIVGHETWSWLKVFFVSSTAARTESGFTEFADQLPKFVASAAVFIHLPKKGAAMIPELMKRCANVKRAGEGIEEIMDSAIKMFETCLNFFLEWAGKEKIYFGDATRRNLSKWIERAERTEVTLTFGDTPSFAELQDAQRVIADGYAIRMFITDERMKMTLQRNLERLNSAMSNFESAITSAKNFRVEPVLGLLAGAPKCGKTAMLSLVASTTLILADLVDGEEAMSHIWQKGTSKYWESYHGQKCVVMDDCFQAKATPGMDDDEYMQIIRQVSSWSCPLNMAQLELKSKIFFMSNMMLGTTNARNILETSCPDVIQAPGAVVRRIHHPLWVEVAPEYTLNGGFDYNKFSDEMARREALYDRKLQAGYVPTRVDMAMKVPWEAWVVRKMKTFDGSIPHEQNLEAPMPLLQWILNFANELVTKKMLHERDSDGLKRYAKTLGSARACPLVMPSEHFLVQRNAPQKIEAELEGADPVVLHSVDVSEEFLSGLSRADYDNLIGRHKLTDKVLDIKMRDGACPEDETEDDVAHTEGFFFSKVGAWLEHRQRAKLNRSLPKEARGKLFAKRAIKDQEMRKLRASLHPDRGDRRPLWFRELSAIKQKELFTKLSSFVDNCKATRECYAAEKSDWEVFKGLMWHAGCSIERHGRRMQAEQFDYSQRNARNPVENPWLDPEHRRGVAISTAICDIIIKLGICLGLTSLVLRAGRALKEYCKGKMAERVESVVKSPEVTDKVETQSNVSENKVGVRKKKFQPATLVAEAEGMELGQLEIRQNIIFRNTYKVYVSQDDPKDNKPLGQVIMLREHVGVMPAHYYRDLRISMNAGEANPDTKLTFKSCGKNNNEFDITFQEFFSLEKIPVEGYDAVFVQFPKRFAHAMTDIVKHILPADDLDAAVATKLAVRLDVANCVIHDGKVTITQQTHFSPHCEHIAELAVANPEDLATGVDKRTNLIKCSAATNSGDCGAPLTIASPTQFKGRCLLGFHFAGKNELFGKSSYSVPLFRENVEAALKRFKAVEDRSEEDLVNKGIYLVHSETDERVLTESGLVGGSIELVGKLTRKVTLAPHSKLRRTIYGLEGVFGPYASKPAHLSPVTVDGVLKYPMVEGIRNYQAPMRRAPIPYVKLAADLASRKFREATIHEPRFLFSFEEAVMGVEGLKIKAINRGTSAGYPYSTEVNMPGKTAFFGAGDEYDFTTERAVQLRARVDEILEAAKDGVRLMHICTDFLKDEVRPDAKVDAVQTRVISGSPLDYVLAFRVMFGAFIAASLRHNTMYGPSPGINPYQDWWKINQVLKESGNTKFFDGDFKRFDASQQPELLWAILDFINQWYNDGEENARIRHVLWLDLVHSRHLTGLRELEFLVQWNKNLPSGHPITTLVNSWYVLFAMMICYLLLVGLGFSHEEAWRRVTFGDDNINSVSDDIVDKFNQLTIANAMAEHLDLVYTSGAKDGKLTPWTELTNCTFLKRGFRYEHGLVGGVNAPLDLNSIVYTVYYDKGKSTPATFEEQFEAMLGELCLHDPSVWDEWYPKVREQMERIGKTPMYSDREAYRVATTSRADFWW